MRLRRRLLKRHKRRLPAPRIERVRRTYDLRTHLPALECCSEPQRQRQGVRRYSAFTDKPEGGNPAGLVLDARGLSNEQMLGIAGDVGYSETALLVPRPSVDGRRVYEVKYFSASHVSTCACAC